MRNRQTSKKQGSPARQSNDDLRIVAQVPLFESQFAYCYRPLPLAFADDVVATEELRADVLARCSGVTRPRGGNQRGGVNVPPPKPLPTIHDLNIKDDPWREGLHVRRLFQRQGGRKSNDLKQRERRRAARAKQLKQLIPPDERTFPSFLAFLDATSDDIECFIADGDIETIVLDAHAQKHIRHGIAIVQSAWTDTRREKARTGFTKEETRIRRLLFQRLTMPDPDG